MDAIGVGQPNSGMLYVYGSPADTSFRLEWDQQVPVEITTTGGDRESAVLWRSLCPYRERGYHFGCSRFVVVMRVGYHASSLAGRVAAIGGRFELISVSGFLAAVVLFSRGEEVDRARAAQSWPGVAYTDLSFPFCAPDAPDCLSGSHLWAPVRADTGAAVPGDAVVQVRSGDTVEVAYRQPTGETVRARRAVQ